MHRNPVIETMLKRKWIRKYTEEAPTDEVIVAIVRAGQQAPLASQLYSVLLARDRIRIPFNAPLLFTICVDAHKLERFMARRNWEVVTNDLFLLLLGIQDAALMAENMVIAAESLGLGSCFLGAAPYHADTIATECKLPQRVFPLVQLAMGYPAEDPPPRPRYPMEVTLFEDRYPELDGDMVSRAMAEMDEGCLSQDYCLRLDAMIPLERDSPETFAFDTYSWTEHISRKWGQWDASPDELLGQLTRRGFRVSGTEVP